MAGFSPQPKRQGIQESEREPEIPETMELDQKL